MLYFLLQFQTNFSLQHLQLCMILHNESAKLRVLRAHVLCVLTCSHANVSCVITCLRALRADVPTCLACLRADVPACLACLRAHQPTCLACSRALCAVRAYVPTCSSAIATNKNKFLLICVFLAFLGLFSLYFSCGKTYIFVSLLPGGSL